MPISTEHIGAVRVAALMCVTKDTRIANDAIFTNECDSLPLRLATIVDVHRFLLDTISSGVRVPSENRA